MIKWSVDFSCNNDKMDEQHKELFDIMEKLENFIVEQNYDIGPIVEVITDLENYVDFHFKTEEKFMIETNYPDYDYHLTQHNYLRKVVNEINVFAIDNVEKFMEDTFQFLLKWLANHILETDKKLGDYLYEKSTV